VASIVATFIASLNVAVTVVAALTFVAPLAGVTAVTVGGVASTVNDHVRLAANALPARSFTRGSVAPPFTVAVYFVAALSGLLGVSVAIRVALS
jgi:hypothetical protein